MPLIFGNELFISVSFRKTLTEIFRHLEYLSEEDLVFQRISFVYNVLKYGFVIVLTNLFI